MLRCFRNKTKRVEVNLKMFEPWHEKLTDKEIKECHGDYIGCEICRNQSRCLELALQEIKGKKNDSEVMT